MLKTIGLIVAVYCMARLFQVPAESAKTEARFVWLWIMSIGAIVLIFFMTVDLLLSNFGSSPESVITREGGRRTHARWR